MECIAHRGFAAEHPENTVPAVRAASAVADWVEVDVRRCGSGDLVVVHDATVDRVTSTTGAVADFDATDLAAMDVLDSGSGIPTLDAVVDAVPPSVGLDVELKERGLHGEATAALRSHGGPTFLSSFDADALPQGADNSVRTALIGAEEPQARLDRAESIGCGAVCLHHEECRSAVVERAHDAGLAVYAWTIREESAAAAARDAGVDGLIADAARFCFSE